jgi:hypothetical protein
MSNRLSRRDLLLTSAARAFANVTGHKELGRFLRETVERLQDGANERDIT